MRDPNRIPEILKRLEELWKKHPDLRLGQLIFGVSRQGNQSTNDVFYIEDDEILEGIKLASKNWKRN